VVLKIYFSNTWPSSVKTAKWIGDCFIYTTGANRLCYFVGNESYTISPFDT
jgi:Coatomer WD associated region.